MTLCMNCRRPFVGRPRTSYRGQDCGWFAQCRDCETLVIEQLELLEDRPGGRSIQILGCRRCGERRACRPGWSTRCHVCLDERTTDDVVNDWLERYRTLPQDLGIALSEIEASVRESVADEGRSTVLDRDRAEAVAALVVADECERRTPDGWTLLATDLKGFPWVDDPSLTESHGTWARHDACGSTLR